MDDPYYQDDNLQQWAQSFLPYQELSLLQIQLSEKVIAFNIGDVAAGTYESISFTREKHRYSFGYIGLPAAARRTLDAIRPTAAADIAMGLEEAVSMNASIEDPCLFVGYSREGPVEEIRADLDILTNALLRKILN